MTTIDIFKQMFKDVSLEIDDLYLLEPFQIGYLPGWAPEQEFAAVLWTYPSIKTFLIKRCPSITDFIRHIMEKYEIATNEQILTKYCDTLVWTIADILVYNKCPEVYDSLEFHNWDFNEITMIMPLEDKVVIYCGSGTGRVALEATRTACHVFALEPVLRLRQFIRKKSANIGINNVFVIDDFLHAIPLPDRFVDVLITSHALGWQLEDELMEFERVTKTGGFIIHCQGTSEEMEEEQHVRLTSPDWKYNYSRYKESDGWKRKYWKQL